MASTVIDDATPTLVDCRNYCAKLGYSAFGYGNKAGFVPSTTGDKSDGARAEDCICASGSSDGPSRRRSLGGLGAEEALRGCPKFTCKDKDAANYNSDDCSKKCYYWEALFEDEFNGSELQKWWDRGVQPACTINNEDQSYTDLDENCAVSGGKLTIQTLKKGNLVSSARLSSKGYVDFLYGRVDVRARLPGGKGTWPAIWMLPSTPGSQWPLGGEIDIMEMVGKQTNKIHGTVHTNQYNHKKGNQRGSIVTIGTSTTEWHIYRLISVVCPPCQRPA